jgi:hypothetical protein
MHDVFSLPHIFIVFHQGSGGNFLAGLVNKIINGDNTVPSIASDGSSHTVIPSCISFGLTPDEQIFYTSREEREKIYLERIKKEVLGTQIPIISWSHDFSNIEFYKKYFKNSKVLCITTESVDEILTCTFMNIYKMLLAVPYNWPISKDVREFRINRLDVSTVALLKELMKPEYEQFASTAYKYRNMEPYKTITNFTMMRLLLTSYGIKITESTVSHENCTFNYITYPQQNNTRHYVVDEHISSFTSMADVIVPYDVLRFGDSNSLVNAISALLPKALTSSEIDLIHSAINQYTRSQNLLMLRNPKQYYLDTKKYCAPLMK